MTTRLAAKEARATALDQQVQAVQAQGPSILAALDSQTTNKVPRWGGAPGDFSAELWLNQVEMLRTMNHEEDLSQLVNQPEARDGYQRAIKQMVRQHFIAGLHNDIKAQISAKL